MRNASRDWGIFALVQAAVCLMVYGSALWGARFLAPLDIAPAIFPAYKFVDPNSNGVPDNHYIIDQLTYDLPLQTIIYDAYHRGEIPWWDPYTYGGRPLLADAHINGTDPIRIFCYLTLPFELAYNWNLILHSLVAASGMFALLRLKGFDLFVCTTMAIAWQFSGAFIMHFGHPWVAGTFVWFPFIWICWERALAGASSIRNTAFSALLCGASFYSGNLQSHLYLPVFGVMFLIGHLSANWRVTMRVATILATSGILGAALAAPVLVNQAEFFLGSTREVAANLTWWQHPAKALLSFGGVFPWATGTFRTLDIGKVVRSSGTAWLVFCGSATFVLALLGLFGRRATSENHRTLWSTSACMVAAYLIIAGTPLANIFYLRIAPLAVLGMVPLAAIGLRFLTSSAWAARPKLAFASAIFVLGFVVLLNGAAFFVYPAIKERLKEAALARDSANSTFPSGAAALREFQISNFPAEVSLRNPETVFSFLGLLMVSAALGSRSELLKRRLACAAMVVSLGPLLHFAGRFVPDHPADMLSSLRGGGPIQQQAIDLVHQNNGRILDRDMQIFPYAMAAFYKVHTIHGYSALQPSGIFRRPKGKELPAEYGADFAVNLTSGGALFVEQLVSSPPMGRLVATDGHRIEVMEETLNSLALHSPTGPMTAFYRTDTPYPGWRTSPNASIQISEDGVATFIQPPRNRSTADLKLLYTPTHLRIAAIVAVLAAITVVILLASPFFMPGSAPAAATQISAAQTTH